LEIGEITARKDSEFNFILTEINTKECGPWTESTGKVLIGEMKAVNWEENILVIGLKIKNMEEEHFSLKIVIDMTDIGWMECHKEKVEWYTIMETFMKVNGTKVKEMVMGF